MGGISFHFLSAALSAGDFQKCSSIISCHGKRLSIFARALPAFQPYFTLSGTLLASGSDTLVLCPSKVFVDKFVPIYAFKSKSCLEKLWKNVKHCYRMLHIVFLPTKLGLFPPISKFHDISAFHKVLYRCFSISQWLLSQKCPSAHFVDTFERPNFYFFGFFGRQILGGLDASNLRQYLWYLCLA